MKAGPRTPAAVCTFWLRDACTRGDTCKFLHERPRATPVPVDAPPATPAVPTVASAAVATEPVRRASQLQQQPRPVAAGRYARLKAPGPLIDIGLNITHKDLYDRDALLQSAVDASVVACVCTGTSLKGSAAGVRMLKGYRGPMQLACTVGIHPHDAKTFEGDKSVAALRALAVDNPQLVKAIGECGLDYDRMFSTRDDQLACFSAQLRLAVELDLPYVISARRCIAHIFIHGRSAGFSFISVWGLTTFVLSWTASGLLTAQRARVFIASQAMGVSWRALLRAGT